MAIETKNITGWKWETKEDFLSARSSADETLGLPIKETNTVQTCMSEKSNDYGGDVFWYCGEHPLLIPILGAPIALTINVEVPDPV